MFFSPEFLQTMLSYGFPTPPTLKLSEHINSLKQVGCPQHKIFLRLSPSYINRRALQEFQFCALVSWMNMR